MELKSYISLQNQREEAYTMILKEKERTTIEDLQTQQNNWKKKSGKKPRQQPRPHHPSKKGHRKY